MQVRFMQRVDYWIGIPLCFLATCFRIVKDLFIPSAKSKPQRILFIELSEMGSAIIAYSALKKAEGIVGRNNLYFLIFRKNRESVDLLDTIPLENVITIDDSSFVTFVFSTLGALLKIRKLKIDTTIDFELFSRCTALLTYFGGSRLRAGFHNYTEEGLYRGSLFTHRVYYNHTQHMALNFLSLLGAVMLDTPEEPMVKKNFSSDLVSPPSFQSHPEELIKIEKLLTSNGFTPNSGRRLVIVNPDPGLLALRGWPIERYREVIENLLKQHSDIYIAIIGLARSKAFYDELTKDDKSGRIIDLTGKTKNLREVVTLFTLSELLLTNDSGPAHMAVLTNIAIVVLFGPETPLRYAPLGKRTTSVFAGLSCSPCYSAANHRHSICTNNVCMQAIGVQEVLSRVEGALRAN